MKTQRVKDLQAFIRCNGFAWPGGYQMALMMADGEAIDAQAARENYRAIRRAGAHDSWDWSGPFIHWEGESLTCAHSGREIPSAYGSLED